MLFPLFSLKGLLFLHLPWQPFIPKQRPEADSCEWHTPSGAVLTRASIQSRKPISTVQHSIGGELCFNLASHLSLGLLARNPHRSTALSLHLVLIMRVKYAGHSLVSLLPHMALQSPRGQVMYFYGDWLGVLQKGKQKTDCAEALCAWWWWKTMALPNPAQNIFCHTAAKRGCVMGIPDIRWDYSNGKYTWLLRCFCNLRFFMWFRKLPVAVSNPEIYFISCGHWYPGFYLPNSRAASHSSGLSELPDYGFVKLTRHLARPIS